MSVTLKQIEAAVGAALGEGGDGGHDWMAFVGAHAIDPEGAGVFCANMARSALHSLGFAYEEHADEHVRALGAAITTACLSCFEAALRASDLAMMIEDGGRLG